MKQANQGNGFMGGKPFNTKVLEPLWHDSKQWVTKVSKLNKKSSRERLSSICSSSKINSIPLANLKRPEIKNYKNLRALSKLKKNSGLKRETEKVQGAKLTKNCSIKGIGVDRIEETPENYARIVKNKVRFRQFSKLQHTVSQKDINYQQASFEELEIRNSRKMPSVSSHIRVGGRSNSTNCHRNTLVNPSTKSVSYIINKNNVYSNNFSINGSPCLLTSSTESYSPGSFENDYSTEDNSDSEVLPRKRALTKHRACYSEFKIKRRMKLAPILQHSRAVQAQSKKITVNLSFVSDIEEALETASQESWDMPKNDKFTQFPEPNMGNIKIVDKNESFSDCSSSDLY